jgi:hypothetical protein
MSYITIKWYLAGFLAEDKLLLILKKKIQNSRTYSSLGHLPEMKYIVSFLVVLLVRHINCQDVWFTTLLKVNVCVEAIAFLLFAFIVSVTCKHIWKYTVTANIFILHFLLCTYILTI